MSFAQNMCAGPLSSSLPHGDIVFLVVLRRSGQKYHRYRQYGNFNKLSFSTHASNRDAQCSQPQSAIENANTSTPSLAATRTNPDHIVG